MEKFIQQIGKKAGEMLLKGFRFKDQTVRQRSTSKGVHTKYDLMVEKFLVGQIKKRYPSHSILGEELGQHLKEKKFFWIIDPLDGTSNFVNHNSFFSVSIALLKNDQPYLSYIYAPFLREEYFAQRGKGAFRNKRRIRVSNISNLEKAYLCFCEGGENNKKRMIKLFGQTYSETKEVRKLGSAALECAWVASGRNEGYFSTKISPWDVAAGVLLVEEAGGQATNFQGRKRQPIEDDFIASNGKIHKRLVNILHHL